MSQELEQYPITLSASAGAWRLYSARKADERFRPFEEKILRRDKYTCRFCGFQAKVYQEIVNLDGDYTHNKIDNMCTACCFCAQCFFLESVGVGGYGGGSLIYLPEMSQSQLNSLCHVLFCAITNDTGYKNTAQTIYRSFKFRSQMVEAKYGEGCSDPAIFGQLLIDSEPVSKEVKNQLFAPLRLLPSRAKFRVQIERWAASALEELATE